MPEVNIEAMNEHLATISRAVAPGAVAAVVFDGAGWHASPRVKPPDNIVLIPLPPYAPELNAAENIWAYLRGNKLSHTVWNSYEEIVDACCEAWNWFMAFPDVVRSVTDREYTRVEI